MRIIHQTMLAGTLGLALGAAAPAQAQIAVNLGTGHYGHIGAYYTEHYDSFTHGPSVSVTIGDPFPDDHDLHAFPQGLHTHVPDHTHYGYYSTGDSVYVVRREDRRVLKRIDRGS